MKKKYIYILVSIIVLFAICAILKNIYNQDSYMNNALNITGDVDGNGKVGTTDYILIRKHILKQTTLTGDKLTRADVNSDGKVNSKDYIMVRKVINGSLTLSTPTPIPVTPTPVPKYEVTYYGATTIETNLNNVTLSGSVAVPVMASNHIKLENNVDYVVSFDYKTSGGKNQFDVDLFPDTLPQIWPTATTTIQHYDWVLSSSDANMNDCQLRFFDDVQESSEQDIIITNINMGTISKVSKSHGDTLGSLPTPSKSGFQFLGWYTDPTGGTQVTSSTQVTSNMKLYPHWKETMYYSPNDPKYNNYPLVASCDSSTLKYKILKHTDDYGRTHYVTVVWVADAYYQMNTALAGDGVSSTKQPGVILSEEKAKYFPNYSSGCMVATNASFFDMTNHRNKDAIVISKGKVYKNNGNAELLGFASDYTFKFFYSKDGTLAAYQNVGIRNTFSISVFYGMEYKNGKYYKSGKEITGDGGNVQTTQICQIDKNNFALINGRGESYRELFKVTGCSFIYNMDGSGSSKLYYQNGSTITAVENGDGRSIANMLYFSEHVPSK